MRLRHDHLRFSVWRCLSRHRSNRCPTLFRNWTIHPDSLHIVAWKHELRRAVQSVPARSCAACQPGDIDAIGEPVSGPNAEGLEDNDPDRAGSRVMIPLRCILAMATSAILIMSSPSGLTQKMARKAVL